MSDKKKSKQGLINGKHIFTVEIVERNMPPKTNILPLFFPRNNIFQTKFLSCKETTRHGDCRAVFTLSLP